MATRKPLTQAEIEQLASGSSVDERALIARGISPADAQRVQDEFERRNLGEAEIRNIMRQERASNLAGVESKARGPVPPKPAPARAPTAEEQFEGLGGGARGTGAVKPTPAQPLRETGAPPGIGPVERPKPPEIDDVFSGKDDTIRLFDITGADLPDDFTKTHLLIPGGRAITRNQFKDLEKSDPQLALALAGGVSTFNKVIDRRQSDFDKKFIKTGAGEYIDRKTWSDIQKSDPDAARVIWMQGVEAHNRNVDKQIKEFKTLYGKTKVETFLERVRAAGATNAIIADPARFKAFLEKNNIKAPPSAVFDSKIRQKGKPDISLQQFVANFAAARGSEKVTPALREAAIVRYQELYGSRAVSKALGVEGAAGIFVPAKALKPELTLKDVTPLEWGLGGAQIALLAAPGIGALAGKASTAAVGSFTTRGIAVASGAIFTVQTVKDWSIMTPGQRAFSVALDTLIIGSALLPRGIRPAATGAKASPAVNASKKVLKSAVAAPAAASVQQTTLFQRIISNTITQGIRAQASTEAIISTTVKAANKSGVQVTPTMRQQIRRLIARAKDARNKAIQEIADRELQQLIPVRRKLGDRISIKEVRAAFGDLPINLKPSVMARLRTFSKAQVNTIATRIRNANNKLANSIAERELQQLVPQRPVSTKELFEVLRAAGLDIPLTPSVIKRLKALGITKVRRIIARIKDAQRKGIQEIADRELQQLVPVRRKVGDRISIKEVRAAFGDLPINLKPSTLARLRKLTKTQLKAAAARIRNANNKLANSIAEREMQQLTPPKPVSIKEVRAVFGDLPINLKPSTLARFRTLTKTQLKAAAARIRNANNKLANSIAEREMQQLVPQRGKLGDSISIKEVRAVFGDLPINLKPSTLARLRMLTKTQLQSIVSKLKVADAPNKAIKRVLREMDVRPALHNWPTAVDDLSAAMRTGDRKGFLQAVRDMARAADQIDDVLIRRGLKSRLALMAANPDEWITITRQSTRLGNKTDDVLKRLNDNRQHLDNIDRAIEKGRRKPRGSDKQAALDKAREETRRQIIRLQREYEEKLKRTRVITKTDEKVKTFLDPDKLKKTPTTTAVTIRKTDLVKTSKGKGAKGRGGLVPVPALAIAAASAKLRSKGGKPQTITVIVPNNSPVFTRKRIPVFGIVPDVTKSELAAITERTGSATREEIKTKTKLRQKKAEKQKQAEETTQRIAPAPEPSPAPSPRPELKVEQKKKTKVTMRLIPRPRRSGSQQKIRRFISQSDGAIAWRQGSVWAVMVSPYESEDDLFVVSGRKKPKGAQVFTGKGSAFRTIQKLRGQKTPKDNTTVDFGFIDYTIDVEGKRLNLTARADPKLETRSDFTVTRRQIVRITPKRRKISR